VFFSRYGNIPLFSPFSRGTSFSRALEEYDRETAENPGLSSGRRISMLNSLEKKARDTENLLSVLKRRRALAGSGAAEALASYAGAAERAGKLYPYSGQIAAIRAEAIVLAGTPGGISDGAEREKIMELAALMTEGALDELALAFSVYSGAMSDPAVARLLPVELFPLLCMTAEGEERERYLVNSAIRILLDGNVSEALSRVNALFDRDPLRGETYLFGAEFFYDHGNFVRSAELFSHFTGDREIARQADALWLAGFAESAETLWKLAGVDGRPGDVRSRSLYNLASISPPDEQRLWLEMLFGDDLSYRPGAVFAQIRFSRLAPTDRALAILEKTDKNEGLFDLELLRRKSEVWSIDKTVVETWTLVNNHPGDSRLYQWAAWYFDFQRRYGETALLLVQAERNGVKEPWIDLHNAFALIRENRLPEAEKLLHAVREQGGYGRFWQIPANLALILDLRRSPREALELYEIAAGLQADTVNRLRSGEAAEPVPELKDAARVQLRIARCLRSLGREAESRRVLDYALDLDPDSLDAALEKRRLENRGIL
jgi:tetratricopeptide (TPR) repeat protein